MTSRVKTSCLSASQVSGLRSQIQVASAQVGSRAVSVVVVRDRAGRASGSGTLMWLQHHHSISSEYSQRYMDGQQTGQFCSAVAR